MTAAIYPLKNPVDNLTDLQVVARTLWGEARGETPPGMQAVANVIVNRLDSKQWESQATLRNICLQPQQFSCWNIDDPNRSLLLLVSEDDPQYISALTLAQAAMDNQLKDVTNNAHYYFVNGIPWPSWAIGRTPCAFIGKHIFFE